MEARSGPCFKPSAASDRRLAVYCWAASIISIASSARRRAMRLVNPKKSSARRKNPRVVRFLQLSLNALPSLRCASSVSSRWTSALPTVESRAAAARQGVEAQLEETHNARIFSARGRLLRVHQAHRAPAGRARDRDDGSGPAVHSEPAVGRRAWFEAGTAARLHRRVGETLRRRARRQFARRKLSQVVSVALRPRRALPAGRARSAAVAAEPARAARDDRRHGVTGRPIHHRNPLTDVARIPRRADLQLRHETGAG